MRRRDFLRSGCLLFAGALFGCGRNSPLAPIQPIDQKPLVDLTAHLDTASDAYMNHCRLYIEGPHRIITCLAPWRETYNIGSVMGYFRQQFKQPVGTGQDATISSRYIFHLDGVSVDDQSIPTWLYAVYPRSLGRLDGDQWYSRLAGQYVDLESLPAAAIVDWRLDVP